MGHILSRPIRPSLTEIHKLRSELSALKHGNVVYFVGCGFMSWTLYPTSFVLAASMAVVAALSGVQYLDRTRDNIFLRKRNTNDRPPQTAEEDLVQEYKNSHLNISLNRKSFVFSLAQLPFMGAALLGCITTGNILGAALLTAAVGYSTKQAFTSLNKWDDALVQKKHIRDDLGHSKDNFIEDKPPSSGGLPDLSPQMSVKPSLNAKPAVSPSVGVGQPTISRKSKI